MDGMFQHGTPLTTNSVTTETPNLHGQVRSNWVSSNIEFWKKNNWQHWRHLVVRILLQQHVRPTSCIRGFI